MGSARNHHTQRQKLRKRLRQNGVPEDEIDRQVEKLRQRQAAARRAGVNPTEISAQTEHQRAEAERRIDEYWATQNPPDGAYRPNLGDSLLRGAGRATGATARAVKRRAKATTKYEHDRQERTA